MYHTIQQSLLARIQAILLAKYDITLRWLGPPEGRRLLNIGCGTGLFNGIAANAGFHVEACEPDPMAYKVARAEAAPGVTVPTAPASTARKAACVPASFANRPNSHARMREECRLRAPEYLNRAQFSERNHG